VTRKDNSHCVWSG